MTSSTGMFLIVVESGILDIVLHGRTGIGGLPVGKGRCGHDWVRLIVLGFSKKILVSLESGVGDWKHFERGVLVL